jgi:uncharacterized protein (DUF2141 family)
MKTKLKFSVQRPISLIVPCFFTALVFVVISRCASPIEHKKYSADSTSVALPDTVVTDYNSEKIVDKKTLHAPLTIIIKNLASTSAPVVVGIYKSKYTFLSKESRVKEYTFIAKKGTLTAHITDINYGEIAVAVYQDMNSNGGFDKNFLGLPKEGYCFSNNFRPIVKAPCFNDCKFNYDSATNTMTMFMIK